MKTQLKQQTVCVHAGKKSGSIGVVNSIEPSSAYHYIDGNEQPYPRYFNTPNHQIVGRQISELENGEAGMIFGSGMTAISTTLLALLKPGDHIVLQKALYGGTHALVVKAFEEWGIEYTFADNSADAIVAAVQDNTTCIYAETPANPLLEIIDLQRLASEAKKKGVHTVVDNTFASPVNQTPLDLGIDVVVHSGTKYLGGHSDLSFGAVVSSQQTIDRIWEKAILLGGTVNALTCYLIERSIKTLGVRVNQQNTNALQLAKYLASHELVTDVFYPGLETHPGHAIAAAQMSGFGGMLSFNLSESVPVKTFLHRLELISPAMSLGGVESSVTLPALTSHKPMPAEERLKLGIGDQLVRLSVGIESAQDLIDDLENAIGSVKRPAKKAFFTI